MKRISMRFLLRGRVQGVGCRAQIATRAGEFGGAEGWVRNLDDGRVEVFARGEAEVLAHWETCLRTQLRPPVRVDAVQSEPWPDDIPVWPVLRAGIFGVEADSPGPLER